MTCNIFQEEISPLKNKILRDHRLKGKHVFPASGYLQLALNHIGKDNFKGIQMKRISFIKPLILESTETKKILIKIDGDGPQACFSIKSRGKDGAWQFHAEGQIVPNRVFNFRRIDLNRIRSGCNKRIGTREYYKFHQRAGLTYGLSLRVIQTLLFNEKEVFSELSLSHKVGGRSEGPLLNPSIMDGAIQALGILSIDKPLSLPFYLDRVEIAKPLSGSCYCYGRLRDDNRAEVSLLKYDLVFIDTSGEIMAVVNNLCLKSIPGRENRG